MSILTCQLCRRLLKAAGPVQHTRAYAAVLPDAAIKQSTASTSKKKIDDANFFESNAAAESAPQIGNKRNRPLKEGGTALVPPVTHVKCTILDFEGNIRQVDKIFPKADFCSKNGLQPRDLRKIDSAVHQAIPTILVRRKCILINVLHIRALIKSDGVYLFDSPGMKNRRLQSAFVKDLQRHLRQEIDSNTLPFELRVVETILASVSSVLEHEARQISGSVEDILAALELSIVPSKLRDLLALSKRLSELQRRAKLVQTALDDILDQDEDLDGMYLTSPRSLDLGHDHQDVEMLLENYSSQVEETVNALDMLVSNVAQTKEVSELILDSSRNSLIALDLKVSIGTMALGSGAFVSALLGMNLTTGFESHPYAFAGVTGTSAFLVATVGLFALKKMRRLREIGLGSAHSRYSLGPTHGTEWARRRLESHISRLHLLDEQMRVSQVEVQSARHHHGQHWKHDKR